MKVAIIGAGASGLFCGLNIKKGIEVDIFEKNNIVGKKLLITGNGRCNVTNLKAVPSFLENVFSNQKFLYSALGGFTPYDMYTFLADNGIKLLEEEDNKIFPVSNKSQQIVDLLKAKALEKANIFTGKEILNIKKEDGLFIVNGHDFSKAYDKVVIATGGKSYPLTGSSGDGYLFAKSFGHKVSTLRPSLCGLKFEDALLKKCMGLSATCTLQISDESNNLKAQEKGDVIFTHFGISGPAVHRLSAKFLQEKIKGCSLTINFLPQLSAEQFEKRLNDFVVLSPNFEIYKLFEGLIAKRLLSLLSEKYENIFKTKAGRLSKQKRQELSNVLTKYKISIVNFDDFERAIVTRGGVEVEKVNPKNMQSKIVEGLFFTGEVLNVDALTGGYNLQIAFATAYSVSSFLNEI